MRAITYVVAPLMFIELLLGFWTVAVDQVEPVIAWCLLLLTILIWFSTVAIQVPLHGRLERTGSNQMLIADLVRTNWLRTLAWSARVVILSLWILS